MPRLTKTKSARLNNMNTYPKLIDLYKTGQKVTLRKPRHGKTETNDPKSHSPPIHFVSEVYDKNMVAKVKEFTKHIFTDIRELNYLRKDMGFLISDLYGGTEHSTNMAFDVNKGRIFFTWVHIPYMYGDVSSCPSSPPPSFPRLPKSIQSDIFPFDIFYLRQPISDADCKTILSLLKKKIDAQVYVRYPHEIPQLPFNISVK